jgi:hypothetical protein
MHRSLLLAILVMPCFANPVIDQSFTSGPSPLGYAINDAAKFVGQTYTAGLTGTLAGVEVDVFVNVCSQQPCIYPLDIQIQSVAGGLPTGTILGETTFSSGQSLLGSLITFATSIPQVAGTQYAIVTDYPTAPQPFGGGNWNGNGGGNLYAGGEAVSEASSGSPWSSSGCDGCDLFFETFVNTSVAIPEPSSLVLVLPLAAAPVLLRRKISGRHIPK